MALMENRCRCLNFMLWGFIQLFLKYVLLKIYLSCSEDILRKGLFKENMLLSIFISVIIQWYFTRKHFTAFYSQGLNSGRVGGAGEENIIMLLQAQHTKYLSFD